MVFNSGINRIFFIFLLLIITTSCNTEVNERKLIKGSDSFIRYQNNLFSGEMYSVYKEFKTPTFNDYITFKPDKKLQRNETFEVRSGLLHGKYHNFFRNGTIQIVGYYLQNKRVGNWVYYDSIGNKIKSTRYSGYLIADTSFNENGDILYIDKGLSLNKIKRIVFNKDTIISEGSLINGKREGSYFELNQNHEQLTGNYVNNLKEGDWVIKKINGETSILKYRKGIEFDENLKVKKTNLNEPKYVGAAKTKPKSKQIDINHLRDAKPTSFRLYLLNISEKEYNEIRVNWENQHPGQSFYKSSERNSNQETVESRNRYPQTTPKFYSENEVLEYLRGKSFYLAEKRLTLKYGYMPMHNTEGFMMRNIQGGGFDLINPVIRLGGNVAYIRAMNIDGGPDLNCVLYNDGRIILDNYTYYLKD